MPVALITGASRGLGLALATGLAEREWSLVVDARDPDALQQAVAAIPHAAPLTALPGDVADPAHRSALAAAVGHLGRLDLLVNNASTLGVSPLPPLALYPLAELERVLAVNVLAPLALVQLLLPPLTRSAGVVVNVSSDAAVEAYPGWGAYGASKASLDQLTRVLAAEQPDLPCYSVDPGDMRTAMHQAAFPGEDISDRPEPRTVVPALLRLLDERPPSGRYLTSALLSPSGTPSAAPA